MSKQKRRKCPFFKKKCIAGKCMAWTLNRCSFFDYYISKVKKKRMNKIGDIVLKVKNLSKTYVTNSIKVEALKDINLEVKKGEFIAIVGPSGAGKTTLINCLGALDFPDSGSIVYNNDGIERDITTMSYSEQKDMRLNKIGLIFQFYNLFPVITAYENVELPMIIAKKNSKENEGRVKELLELVGLSKRMYHYPTQMSGGEQQRVTIARSLANSPLILLADEPTGELDTETTLKIIKIFLQLKEQGNSILIVTHNSRIAQAADRIITILDGKIMGENAGGRPIEQLFGDET